MWWKTKIYIFIIAKIVTLNYLSIPKVRDVNWPTTFCQCKWTVGVDEDQTKIASLSQEHHFHTLNRTHGLNGEGQRRTHIEEVTFGPPYLNGLGCHFQCWNGTTQTDDLHLKKSPHQVPLNPRTQHTFVAAFQKKWYFCTFCQKRFPQLQNKKSLNSLMCSLR